MAEYYMELVRRTGVDGRDLALTYVLPPSRLYCPKFRSNRVHRVYKDIPEHTGGDREDGVD